LEKWGVESKEGARVPRLKLGGPGVQRGLKLSRPLRKKGGGKESYGNTDDV